MWRFSPVPGRALAMAAILCLGACSDQAPPREQKAPAAAKVASAAPTAPSVADAATNTAANAAMAPDGGGAPATAPAPADPNLPPVGQAIDQAAFSAGAGKASTAAAYDPALVKVEVLLDRAGFSPGVIDGKPGTNLRHALAAYASAHGLASHGTLDQASWNALTQNDRAPAMLTYQITDADEKGPFVGVLPKDYRELAKLPFLGYASPLQQLAERFHMDADLVTALNPHTDFSRAGTTILLVASRSEPRKFDVSRIVVDKSNDEVRAYDAAGKLTAYYPATVGSTERPAPSGLFKVVAVAPHPAYYYDPARLTFAPEGATGKLRIAPGPNNPVGLTWIALNIPTYGIHGAPDPRVIGKRQSHGCVRLTNWDAVELGRAVKKGVVVEFTGTEAKPGKKA